MNLTLKVWRQKNSNYKGRLVDYKNYGNNSFIAINQFRLLTPGASRQGIIPNIVLFLNGMPIVVVEAKDFDVAEPLSEAYLQVTRYANTRDDDYGFKEGEEKLFHYNIWMNLKLNL